MKRIWLLTFVVLVMMLAGNIYQAVIIHKQSTYISYLEDDMEKIRRAYNERVK